MGRGVRCPVDVAAEKELRKRSGCRTKLLEPEDLTGMDNVTSLLMKGSAAAKIFAGVPYLLALFGGYSQTFLDGFKYDMGTKLLVLAGLFNLLALADAFSLAFPEKKPAAVADAAWKDDKKK